MCINGLYSAIVNLRDTMCSLSLIPGQREWVTAPILSGKLHASWVALIVEIRP